MNTPNTIPISVASNNPSAATITAATPVPAIDPAWQSSKN